MKEALANEKKIEYENVERDANGQLDSELSQGLSHPVGNTVGTAAPVNSLGTDNVEERLR